MPATQASPIKIEAEVTIEIPFQDADPMGVTWHGNYLRYMESARSALLDHIGYNYDEMLASGFVWPIVDMRVKYLRPTRFKQIIVCRASLAEYENRLKILYTAFDPASNEQIMKAHTIQVAVDREQGEMCFCSPDVLINAVLACEPSS